ncbi:MAG TPA: DUF4105 domain-containing protein [Candidatus Methylomirabilis sp.]|nr:DUF4105 domain-containing protein [Candidatus Methylomirabilis sp.]
MEKVIGAPARTGRAPGLLFRPFVWLIRGLGFIARVLLLAWATLAIHFSNLPWPWARTLTAVAFLAFGIWSLWIARWPRRNLAFAAAFLAVVAWFVAIPPSHHRPWRPEVAVMPRATIDGDRVHITGVRNFDYRSRSDFTVRYEERDVSLSHLYGIDFFVSYFWPDSPVGHTFLSFLFDDAPPLAISIETRPEVGEGFDPLPSLFKQFELIYLVGEERDIVAVRTNYRREQVFLYPMRTSPDRARRLFLVYLERINELADRPEWYHLLSNSCTVNIVRYANRVGRQGGFDLRHMFNGWIDRYLYSAGVVDTSLPFDELRRRSNIDAAAQEGGTGPGFSERIRRSLPGAR